MLPTRVPCFNSSNYSNCSNYSNYSNYSNDSDYSNYSNYSKHIYQSIKCNTQGHTRLHASFASES